MKKIISNLLILIGCMGNTMTFAKDNLCIALLNNDTVPVNFTTAADPGYVPVVQPNENKILPGDFMVSCAGKNTCIIYISPLDHKYYTKIDSVPMGAQIYYYGHNSYNLDVNAHVQCQD